MTAAKAERDRQDDSNRSAVSNEEVSSVKHVELDKLDIDKELDLEKADESGEISGTASRCPSERNDDLTRRKLLSFTANDPLNPHCWPQWKKIYVVIAYMLLVLNSTIGSSIASGATEEMSKAFNITNQVQLVLPTSIYLLGYCLGPLFFAPLSETYGRKIVMISTFILYTAFSLGCALTPTWAGLIIMRLFVGIGASTPISVIGGIYADIYKTPKARGRAITIFMTGTVFGPLIGPIASGYIAVVSWRWVYWLQLIIAGATWPFLLLAPETYAPVLLKRQAQKLRKQRDDPDIVAPIELEQKGLKEIFVVVLTRPFRMFFFEALVLCSCLYTAVVYALFYMFLQAFPLIYEDIYGFNAGEEGITFLPIGIGAIIACGIYLFWDHYLDQARTRSPPPKWTQSEEYRRVPLACLASPLFVFSMFWLGWTARSSIHWIVPVLAAIPFGVAYLLCFMALINYIVDAYEIFSASAMAAASCSRSLFAVVLPFAAKPMYETLGVPWACSLLGFVSLAMGIIPFVFIKYGDRIRASSAFCQELKRKKEDEQRKDAADASKRERAAPDDLEAQV